MLKAFYARRSNDISEMSDAELPECARIHAVLENTKQGEGFEGED